MSTKRRHQKRSTPLHRPTRLARRGRPGSAGQPREEATAATAVVPGVPSQIALAVRRSVRCANLPANLTLAAGLLSTSAVLAQSFPAEVDLSSLDGGNGFVINGIDFVDRSGESVSSAGDINGDGVDDVIIGARLADPNGNSNAGESYIVFGGPSVGAGGSLDLSSLTGADGFVINGIDSNDYSGRSVSSAGDINGDGVDDVIIGARDADPNGNSRAGESYIVFGGPSVGAGGSLDLSTLSGADGFVINGVDSDDRSGYSVSSAADINGDGVDDVIIGARDADPNGNTKAGESYIVFGGPAVGAGGSLDLSSLTGADGFVINGIGSFEASGRSVSSAGDINGDGVDDVIIGAVFADPNGNSFAGESYIVFGSPSVGAGGSLDLSSLTGADGFVINGIDSNDRSGISVSSAGDINGDGVNDVIIGAYLADPNGNGSAGESYIVFGGPSVGAGGSLDLSSLTGADGFVINGIDSSDYSGGSVSSAGDINDDGVDDVIIGASRADPNGDNDAGESYIVFGGPSVGAGGSLDLSSLTGADGFVINGIDIFDLSGFSVSSAGDINGDGVDDVIIGAYSANPNGNSEAGESYIVFGIKQSPTTLNNPDPQSGDRMGYATAIDGGVAAVGNRLNDAGGLTNSGSVEIFSLSAGQWVYEQTLISSAPGQEFHFGHAVGLDGNWLVVGEETSNVSGFRAGAVHLFEYTGMLWESRNVFLGDSARDLYGRSVAIDGTTLLVGIPNDDDLGDNAGAARIIDVDAAGASVGSYPLIGNDTAAEDKFGNAVSISGDYAVVGAFRDDDTAAGSGSAYVFHRNQGGMNAWGQVAKLVAPSPVANDQFGFSVSLSEDTIAIGARLADSATANQIGAVFVYTGTDTTGDGILDDWSDVTQLTASDALAGDRFGTSVALDGDYLLAGAPARDELGDRSGIAYSFTRDALGFWNQQARLFDPNTTSTRDEFGISVAIDQASRHGLVGAWLDNVPGANNSGTASVFDLF